MPKENIIIVLGANGMLGHKLCEQFAAAGRDVIATFRKPSHVYKELKEVFGNVRCIGDLDVMDNQALTQLFQSEQPAAVINCVGVIKQLDTINNRRVTVGINSYLPHLLERQCGEIGARLVHFSTDCVFSGRKGAYRESDSADEIGLYGLSKYLGETTGLEGCSVTLRTSVIGRELGSSAHGIIEWFMANRGRRVRGFARAVYSGFTTIEMARIVGLVIDRPEPLQGLYHVASAPISKYDLLRLVRDEAGLATDIDRDENFVCDRSLVMDRFTVETGYTAPTWKQMIKEMIVDPVPYDRYKGKANA